MIVTRRELGERMRTPLRRACLALTCAMARRGRGRVGHTRSHRDSAAILAGWDVARLDLPALVWIAVWGLGPAAPPLAKREARVSACRLVVPRAGHRPCWSRWACARQGGPHSTGGMKATCSRGACSLRAVLDRGAHGTRCATYARTYYAESDRRQSNSTSQNPVELYDFRLLRLHRRMTFQVAATPTSPLEGGPADKPAPRAAVLTYSSPCARARDTLGGDPAEVTRPARLLYRSRGGPPAFQAVRRDHPPRLPRSVDHIDLRPRPGPATVASTR